MAGSRLVPTIRDSDLALRIVPVTSRDAARYSAHPKSLPGRNAGGLTQIAREDDSIRTIQFDGSFHAISMAEFQGFWLLVSHFWFEKVACYDEGRSPA